jgi:N-acetyl sugar amidotransferase
MSKDSYIICNRCIMDTSDPRITFDSHGICDYCNNFDKEIASNWYVNLYDEKILAKISAKIKAAGRGKAFDCIIGLSGGLDSSYTAFVAKEVMGLRPLLFHVDAGWNTDQAVSNIEKLVDGLDLDLYTEVINWEEMKDLQVAFLKAQVADQDAPQDTAFFSALYKFARRNRVEYVLTGANYSTECCREPEEWGAYPGIDKTLIRDIHARFGKRPLKTFPIVDIVAYKIFYQQLLGMKVVKPLNLFPYVKKNAEQELYNRFGWRKFKHKHHESRFTRFYEDYWLPRKFGYEKRRAHFASLIMTGQMTRGEALERISLPEMDEHFLNQEFEYVAHKLDLTVEDLRALFKGENKTYRDYRNKRWAIGLGANVLRAIGLERRLFR